MPRIKITFLLLCQAGTGMVSAQAHIPVNAPNGLSMTVLGNRFPMVVVWKI